MHTLSEIWDASDDEKARSPADATAAFTEALCFLQRHPRVRNVEVRVPPHRSTHGYDGLRTLWRLDFTIEGSLDAESPGVHASMSLYDDPDEYIGHLLTARVDTDRLPATIHPDHYDHVLADVTFDQPPEIDLTRLWLRRRTIAWAVERMFQRADAEAALLVELLREYPDGDIMRSFYESTARALDERKNDRLARETALKLFELVYDRVEAAHRPTPVQTEHGRAFTYQIPTTQIRHLTPPALVPTAPVLPVLSYTAALLIAPSPSMPPGSAEAIDASGPDGAAAYLVLSPHKPNPFLFNLRGTPYGYDRDDMPLDHADWAKQQLEEMRDVFIHEVTHFLDNRRIAATHGPAAYHRAAASYPTDPRAEMRKYVNHPSELNAFFQQVAGERHADIQQAASQVARAYNLRSAERGLVTLQSFARLSATAFVDAFLDDYPYRDRLRQKNLRRVRKRAADLYLDLRAIAIEGLTDAINTTRSRSVAQRAQALLASTFNVDVPLGRHYDRQ